MTNAAHTPGPWHYTAVSDGSFSVHQTKSAPYPIAHDIVTKEDACLIAAAPELLNALECLLLYAADVHSEDLNLEVYEQARSAIAKSKGG
jgi:hypothetical protein